MLDWIYSLIFTKSAGHYSLKISILVIGGYASAGLFIPVIIGQLFPQKEMLFQFLGALLFGIAMVLPVVRIFHPGYRYRKEVERLTLFQTTFILLLISILPIALIAFTWLIVQNLK